MHSRRSSRQTVDDTSQYLEISDDSDQDSEKQPKQIIDKDDEYQDPSEKRAKPAAKRVKSRGHALSQAQSSVAVPPNPELAIERKEEINFSSISDFEHQDLSIHRDKPPLKRVKTEGQDLQVSSAVATSAPEPAMERKTEKGSENGNAGEHQGSSIQPGEPPLKRVKTDSQDLQVLSTVTTSAPEPGFQMKVETSTGSASDIENQDSEIQHSQPPTKRIKFTSKDSQVSLAVAASNPDLGTERKTEENSSLPNDDERQESLTTPRVNTEDQDSKFPSAVAASPKPRDDMDRKPGSIRVILPADTASEPKSLSRPSPRKSKSKSKVKTVEQRIAAVEKQVAEIKQTHKKEMEKMTERRLEEVGKATDDIIEKQWVQLNFNINSIAIELSEHLFVSSKPVRNIKKELLNSFMWNWVYADFFLGRGSLWGGGIVREVQMVRRKLIANREATESRTECAKWLSQAHRLAVVQPNKEALAQAVHEFSDTLLAMVLPEEQEKCRGQLKANLDNVVRLATELTELFLSSKALLVPDWPCRWSKYRIWKKREIESEYLTDEGSRERYLIKSPGLEKYGNADGENHHLSTVLRKPQIVFY